MTIEKDILKTQEMTIHAILSGLALSVFLQKEERLDSFVVGSAQKEMEKVILKLLKKQRKDITKKQPRGIFV